jgi:hypothetical protein
MDFYHINAEVLMKEVVDPHFVPDLHIRIPQAF